jgi:hypothetical protein
MKQAVHHGQPLRFDGANSAGGAPLGWEVALIVAGGTANRAHGDGSKFLLIVFHFRHVRDYIVGDPISSTRLVLHLYPSGLA